MPLYDTSTILGGFGQQISDWALGDDRQFVGDINSLLIPGDQNVSEAYFTLKENTSDTDANAIVQKEITQISTLAGQITTGVAGNKSLLIINVYAGDYVQAIYAGTTYYWDFRLVTAGGRTVTVAQGTVVYGQNVTQASASGTPAPFGISGQPRFRGFAGNPPTNGIYTQGDFFMNSNPQPGEPSGWACAIGGAPGTWYSLGITGDIPTGGVPYTVSIVVTPRFLGYSASPPTTGTHNVGDWVRNIEPQPDSASGWVCIGAGTPGTWVTDGIVGETA